MVNPGISSPNTMMQSNRKEPDMNSMKMVTTRLPGRADAGDTTFTSSTELAAALPS